ncbi:MAG TPA: hypothetical protein VE869_02750 [Gemmatimonas sp.]|nr:hypothetical protein [Gemmatimonas sp.]
MSVPATSLQSVAIADPELRAVVVRQVPLRYADGADPSVDRPAHVRAGSSLARVPDGIALVQDDANFIAIVDPLTGLARAIALPAGDDGKRQFDSGRGNKASKFDLEACISVPVDGDTLLVALGSGSTARREQAVLLDRWQGREPRVRLHALPQLYAALRESHAFAGSELNLEGAMLLEGHVWLFARGNGASSDGSVESSATCRLGWSALLAHLENPEAAAPPAIERVTRYDLGEIDGVRLGFTDAARWGDSVLYAAAAEASDDAVNDGDVAGSALGVIDGDGVARWVRLTTPDGSPFPGKVEGVLPPHDDEGHVYGVLDADDAETPSTLITVRLHGCWQRARDP